jgi:hypothetical protein
MPLELSVWRIDPCSKTYTLSPVCGEIRVNVFNIDNAHCFIFLLQSTDLLRDCSTLERRGSEPPSSGG